MEWLNRNKFKIIIPLAIIIVLTAAFFANPIKKNTQAVKEPVSSESTVTVSDVEPVSSSEETGPAAEPNASVYSSSDNPNAIATSAPAFATVYTGSDVSIGSDYEIQPSGETDNSVVPETTGTSQNESFTPDTLYTQNTADTKPSTSATEGVSTQQTTSKTAETTSNKETDTIKQNSCRISISCATVLNNMNECDPAKRSIIPADGWILKEIEYDFNEGDSVFDVLKSVCIAKKIHLEFSMSPLYNTAYIEGINNLYEFDVGELSGWEYCVNGWYPNYGCSGYKVQNGDVICWRYTCDRGYDIDAGFD